MPKNILSKIMIFSLAILFFSSCKKEKEENPQLHLIPQEVKDYCYFKMGSWWIYKDSLSGAYDTVVMTESILDTINYYEGNKIVQYSEVFKTKMSTTFDDYYISVDLSIPPPPGMEKFWVRMTRYKAGDARSPSYFETYPYIINEYISLNSDDSSILLYNENDIKIYRHGKISNIFYAKVLEIHKRNIGVIRREIDNPYILKKYVWKLDSYLVVQ